MLKQIEVLSIFFAVVTVAAMGQTTVTNANNGTTNVIPKFNGSASLTNSAIYESGGSVGIGTSSPFGILHIQGPLGQGSWVYHIGNVNGANPLTFFTAGTALGWNESGGGGESNLVFGSGAGSNPGLQIGEWDGTTYKSDLFIQKGGNVGIGTTGPTAALDVLEGTDERAVFSPGANGYYSGATGIISVNNTITAYEPLAFYAEQYAFGGGNVGIGTTSPGTKLEVDGSIKLSSGSGASMTYADGTAQSTAWTGTLTGGDYAESVDITGNRDDYEPGDVLVVDPDHDGRFLKAQEPYSLAVTGVYSTKPGVVGRRQKIAKELSKTEVPMAMVGIVPIKVSTENGPIRRGDPLVTSSTAGYAMKGTNRNLLAGAVIGKSLGSLDSGTGVIEAVISLQ